MCAEGALAQPMLYLSLYFKKHRDAYYDLLMRVRTEGAWRRGSIFSVGIIDTTEQATRHGAAHPGIIPGDRARVEKLGGRLLVVSMMPDRKNGATPSHAPSVRTRISRSSRRPGAS